MANGHSLNQAHHHQHNQSSPKNATAVKSEPTNQLQHHHQQQLNAHLHHGTMILTNGNGHQQLPISSAQSIIVTTGGVDGGQQQQQQQFAKQIHIKNELLEQNTVTQILQQQQSLSGDVIHIKSDSNGGGNAMRVKSEPIDPLPPLASPAGQMVMSAAATGNADADQSPPQSTVISLAPAQPYPSNGTGSTQLAFASPSYDLSGAGQYAVQVCLQRVASENLLNIFSSCLGKRFHGFSAIRHCHADSYTKYKWWHSILDHRLHNLPRVLSQRNNSQWFATATVGGFT